MPDDLLARLNEADRLAPLMTSANGISGNPRLIKRFMNALSIRMTMANNQGVVVDEATLAKVLLFERSGDPRAYSKLVSAVTESETGMPEFLTDWETDLSNGEDLTLESPWNSQFTMDWLRLPPHLGTADLRGVLYVSREHAPLITSESQLSDEAMELLQACLNHPDMASMHKDRLSSLPKPELETIFNKLLTNANNELEWGTPPLLDPCLLVVQIDSTHAQSMVAFLKERPPSQITPSIIPRLEGESWANPLFDHWSSLEEISGPVKRSIKVRSKK